VIDPVHGLFKCTVAHSFQIATFREMLADKTIGILAQPTFRGSIRMSEIDPGIKVSCRALLVGEFAAIVTADGMDPALMPNEPYGGGLPGLLGTLSQ